MDSWSYHDTDDLRRMQALCSRLWSQDEAPFQHPGGLAWGRRQHLGRESEWPTRLWGTPDRLIAWAWLELPGHLTVLVEAGADGLAGEVVAWFEETATGDTLTVDVPDGHDAVGTALSAAGFAERPESPFDLDMRCVPADAAEPALPPGYAIRTLADFEGDPIPERAALHRASWSLLQTGAVTTSRVTEGAYRQLALTWPYRADLDVVAVAPDGAFAASCIAWLDPVTNTGELEPVGTHPDHRGRQLAGAVCLAALRELARAGAGEAVVHPRGDDGYSIPRSVYGSVGFRLVNRTRTYSKLR